MRPSEPTIIFLHIGKTAGASLRRILRRQFRRSEIIEFRAPLPEPGRLRREGALAAFADIPERRRAAARLVMGHTTYGIHELIPRPSTYVTMFRDPVALVTSLYRYILRTPLHVLHDELVSRDLSLDGFVTSGLSVEADNSQTRAIAGDTTTPFGGCDDAMLERAKRHVEERFAVAGTTERFDETLLLMRRTFGWSGTYYVATNVAPTGARLQQSPAAARSQPSQATVELIRERNRFDTELYRWASERFEATLASIPDVDSDLERFRRNNRLYRPWGLLTDDLPRRVATGLRRRSHQPATASS